MKLNVDIDDDFYRKARTYCDRKGIRFAEFVVEAIDVAMIDDGERRMGVEQSERPSQQHKPHRCFDKRLLREGDRIRVNVRLMSGWKGLATVTEDQYFHDGSVRFRKDGDPNDGLHNRCCAMRYQVSKLRNPIS